jgi:signal transduction histidine kinase/ActR/RegA family two-component response regulator
MGGNQEDQSRRRGSFELVSGQEVGRQALIESYVALGNQLREMAENTDGALVLLDREQRVVLLTPAWAEMFEVKNAHFSGLPARALLSVCSEKLVGSESFAELVTGGLAAKKRSTKAGIETTDGQPLTVEVQAIFSSDAEVEGWIISVSGADDQTLGDPSNLIRILGHELQMPLQGVIASADLLAESTLDSQQMEILQALRSSGQALTDAINGTMLLGQDDPDSCRGLPHVYRLNEIFIALHALLRSSSEVEGTALAFWLGLGLDRPRLFEARFIRHILMNLVGNALKFAAGGQVDVRAEVLSGDLVRFSVSDDGPGVAPEDRERIFRPFERGGEEHEGSGLGLYIANRMVKAMDGPGIELDSSPMGAIFSFTIPMPEEDEPAPAPEVTREGGQVLIVDDHQRSRSLLAQEIKLLGLEPIEAGSSEEALRIWKDRHPDIALIDFLLPQETGVELARRMRAVPGRRPIISISGLGEDREFFLGSGFDDHLPKPVTFHQLRQALERHLGPSESLSRLIL